MLAQGARILRAFRARSEHDKGLGVIIKHTKRTERIEGDEKHGLVYEMFRQQSLRSFAQHDKYKLGL